MTHHAMAPGFRRGRILAVLNTRNLSNRGRAADSRPLWPERTEINEIKEEEAEPEGQREPESDPEAPEAR